MNIIATSIYYASLLKFDQILLDLNNIEQAESVNMNVNVQERHCGNALQTTSFKGHDKVMQMLLEKGADVNAQGGLYGNALQAALFGDYDQVVQMLLEKGAK